MRLAFSTNAYLQFPFDEAAERIAAFGYEGLELMADVPHAWPAGLLEGPKRAIREAMERNGLAFSNVNAFMMNAIADHRQPYWYPVVHRARPALPPGPDRPHPAGPEPLRRAGRAAHHDRAGRAARPGAVAGRRRSTCSSRSSSRWPSTPTSSASCS